MLLISYVPVSLVFFLSLGLILMNLCFFLESGVSLVMDFSLSVIAGVIINIPLVIDKVSLLFSASVGLISLSVIWYSMSYMESEKYYSRFHWLVFFFVLSMLLLIFSPNIISLILGWDGLGVTSFLLVIYFNSSKSFNAGMITALSNRVGDCLILLSMSMFAGLSPISFFFYSDNFFLLDLFLIGFVVVAATTKSAQIPFSAWLPAAMAAPTPVSSLVHSSTLVTAGVYLMIRFNYLLGDFLGKWLFLVGCFTMIMASLSAFFESDLKKIIALSTLSQLGLMMIGVGLMQVELAFFHLLVHAYFKAMMFMAVGSLIHMNSSVQDLRLTSVSSSVLGVTLSVVMVANLSLMGVPYLGGFYSKDAIIESCLVLSMSSMEVCLMVVSIAFTAIYSLRFMVKVLWGSLNFCCLNWSQDNNSAMNTGMLVLWPLAIMGGSLVMWIMFPEPLVLVLMNSSKLLTLLMVLMGVGLSVVWFKGVIFYGSLFLSSSYGNLWSLPNVSSGLIYEAYEGSLSHFQRLDVKWGFYLFCSKFIFWKGVLSVSSKLVKIESIGGLMFFMLMWGFVWN